jgi:hypothetical protein
MIKGFEEETYELKEGELKHIVPIIANLIGGAVGKENAIRSTDMLEYLELRNYRTSDSRIRKMVQYLRMNKKLRGLIAGNGGYYISKDPKEIREYAENSYGSRIREMEKIKVSILEDAHYYEQA